MNDEEMKELIEDFDEENGFSRACGMRVTKAENGYARIDMDVKPMHLNPINSIHGGAIFTLADSAAGTAAYSLNATRSTLIDADMHYLRPGINKTHIYAEGRVIKKGHKVVVTEVTVRDQDDTELAMGIFSDMILDSSKAESSGWKKPLTAEKN